MPCAATAVRSEVDEIVAKLVALPRRTALRRPARPSAAAISIAPSYPFSAQKSSQYECIGFSEYPSWLIDAGKQSVEAAPFRREVGRDALASAAACPGTAQPPRTCGHIASSNARSCV